MKRLKSKLLGMEPQDTTYFEMYNATISIVDPVRYWAPPIRTADPIYYRENIGFKITATNKLAEDKPTITIIIPNSYFLKPKESDIYMKRLKYYLLQMQNDTSTYKDMYEGEVEVIFPSVNKESEIQYDNRYWHNESTFTIEKSNKLSQDKPTVTLTIPTRILGIKDYVTSAADHCLREFVPYIDELNAELYNRSRPDNENGKYYIHRPGGEILVRNTAYFKFYPAKDYENGSGNTVYLLESDRIPPSEMCLCIKLQVQLPKRKLRKTIQMLCKDLPDAVDRFISDFDTVKLEKALKLSEKQQLIRNWLKNSEYCSFIANGSILPRAKGTALPMLDAIPFKSTSEDEIDICGIRGMGIKKGVTVITGGGYSGKSTLLDAISAGIYNHVQGDGRELCITDESAVTISAEDGRSVKNLNISPFIKWVPGGDTKSFSTDHASGSTSQAANIMETIETGAKLLLIDEDRSATNFMIRDRMMKTLIEKEPITPFTDRVNELYVKQGVSTILVIGGSGEYLSVADKIYMMEDYIIQDVTNKAAVLCRDNNIYTNPPEPTEWLQSRTLYNDRFTSYPEGMSSERLEVSDLGFIIIGDERIDVRGLHDIVSHRQLDALGFMLRYLEISNTDLKINIKNKINDLYDKIEKEGLDIVFSSYFTTCERFLDLPRKHELFALINRMRKLKWIINR